MLSFIAIIKGENIYIRQGLDRLSDNGIQGVLQAQGLKHQWANVQQPVQIFDFLLGLRVSPRIADSQDNFGREPLKFLGLWEQWTRGNRGRRQ